MLLFVSDRAERIRPFNQIDEDRRHHHKTEPTSRFVSMKSW
jgi:hypothetical protein